MYYKPPQENAVNEVVCKADLAAPQTWENSYHLWEILSHLTRNENVEWKMKWFMKDDMSCLDTMKERNWILHLNHAFLSTEIVSKKKKKKIEVWPHHNGSITMPEIMMPLPMAYNDTEKHITTDTMSQEGSSTCLYIYFSSKSTTVVQNSNIQLSYHLTSSITA